MSEFDNFIYTNDNAMSKEVCQEMMNYTNDNLDGIKEREEHTKFIMKDIYPTQSRPDYPVKTKSDFAYFWTPYSICSPPQILVKKVIEVIMGGLHEYVKKYPAITLCSKYGISFQDIKYHVVKEAQGYHAWHSEWTSTYPEDRRILVWHISLTNHENEGELEFLYHDERVPARAGRLVIWPAFFPWLHRGNAIRTDTEKHYLTGWFTSIEQR